jgi:hypothetical protein
MRWEKFEANEYFPNGLKGLTSEIRRRFKHIKHIAVWHAVIGYWEGISPEYALLVSVRGFANVALGLDCRKLFNHHHKIPRRIGCDIGG